MNSSEEQENIELMGTHDSDGHSYQDYELADEIEEYYGEGNQ